MNQCSASDSVNCVFEYSKSIGFYHNGEFEHTTNL